MGGHGQAEAGGGPRFPGLPGGGDGQAKALGAGDALGLGRARKQDAEFLAAEPGKHVRRAQQGPDGPADPLQHLVAHGMAKSVVDMLEMIDVERDDGCLRGFAHALVERGHRAVHEGPTSQHAGQEIAMGKRAQLELVDHHTGELFEQGGVAAGKVARLKPDHAQRTQVVAVWAL